VRGDRSRLADDTVANPVVGNHAIEMGSEKFAEKTSFLGRGLRNQLVKQPADAFLKLFRRQRGWFFPHQGLELFPEIFDHRNRFAHIVPEPFPHDFRLVVLPLNELSAAAITNSVLPGRVAMDIVERAVLKTDAPAAETFLGDLEIQGQDDHGAELQLTVLEYFFHQINLPHGTGKPVKEDKIAGHLFQLMGNDALQQLHGHQLARALIGFDFLAQGCSAPDFFFQQVAGFDHGDVVARGERAGQGGFPAALGSKEHRRALFPAHISTGLRWHIVNLQLTMAQTAGKRQELFGRLRAG